MGTSYNVKMVFDAPKSSNELLVYKQAIDKALDLVDRLMSTYRNDSEVSAINDAAIGSAIALSAQTYDVLFAAQEISRLTNGFFDITVGPLVDLWGFGSSYKPEEVPSSFDIISAKNRVDWNAVQLQTNKVVKKNDVRIDLSAIAKGYAVDQVAQSLRQLNVVNYLVEVGGEISVLGRNKQKNPWLLGIELPATDGRKAYTTVSLESESLATSGDYRNFYEQDGVRYSHAIDPGTGYPVTHRLASVSVITDSCMESDALATALIVMGEDVGYQFALKENINAYFIYRENNQFKTIYTPGFEHYLN